MRRAMRRLSTAVLLYRCSKKPRTKRYVWIARRRDGKYWMGPWKLRGNGFAASERLAYKWGSEAACRSALLCDGVIEATPVKVEYVRPSERR